MSFFNWQAPSSPTFDSDGRIQPLNCKRGELANRIITVGDPLRARRFLPFFDSPDSVIERVSTTVMVTYTGTVGGVPVSVIATGMGFAMAELMLVQALAITDGPVYCVRFGTSGSISAAVPVGCFAVTDRIYYVRQNYERYDFPYEIPPAPLPMAPDLCAQIADAFRADAPEWPVAVGPGFSADTFYGSQGRSDPAFVNNNEGLIAKILETEPEAVNFEMESYLIAFIASICTGRAVKVGAVCITLAQRTAEGVFLDNERKHEMEDTGARVLTKLLASLPS